MSHNRCLSYYFYNMRPKVIWTIVILMSISLIGLTAFQVYWIDNAVRLNRSIFQENVMSSLRQVVTTLEHREVAKIVESNYISYTDEGMQLIIKEQGTSYESAQFYVMHRDSLPVAQKVIRKADSTIIKVMPGIPPPPAPDQESSPASAKPPLPEVERLAMELDTTMASVEQKLLTKSRVVNVVMEQLINPHMAHERIRAELIDTLLHQALANNGIHLPYQFAIWHKPQDSILSANVTDVGKSLMNTPLKAALFPNDLISTNNYLLVNFPDERYYLYGQIWTTLVASIIFILVIVACFTYAIYVIFRQKKLSEMKNDFINNMTHELKTPIATVRLAVEALNEKEMRGNEATLLRYLGIIDHENTRLSSQVEKVLQSALLDKETFALKKEPIALDQLLREVIEKAEMAVSSRGGTLNIHQIDAVQIMADRHHLTNVLTNLIDNAIKYSKKEPHLEMGTTAHNQTVQIWVKDHGIGIAPDAQRYVFDKFYRVPTGNRHDVKGFGLGLSYVKTIIEKHGGHVAVKSEKDVGSTFTIELPYGE